MVTAKEAYRAAQEQREPRHQQTAKEAHRERAAQPQASPQAEPAQPAPKGKKSRKRQAQ